MSLYLYHFLTLSCNFQLCCLPRKLGERVSTVLAPHQSFKLDVGLIVVLLARLWRFKMKEKEYYIIYNHLRYLGTYVFEFGLETILQCEICKKYLSSSCRTKICMREIVREEAQIMQKWILSCLNRNHLYQKMAWAKLHHMEGRLWVHWSKWHANHMW